MKLANRYCHGPVAALALIFLCTGHNADADPASAKDKQSLVEGKELFTREWLHGDRRSYAGDGLGPVFNARSCVACHHQGGAGGAGGKETNATVVSAFVQRDTDQPTALGAVLVQTIIDSLAHSNVRPKQPGRAKLAEIHPALRTENSFALHRFPSEPELLRWSQDALRAGRIDDANVVLISSERNAPALFGAGLIDRIPDRVLLDIAAEQAKTVDARSKDKPDSKSASGSARNRIGDSAGLPLSGRVSRLKNGRIGRFGWKCQVATLQEFTLQACSSELGLEVPGFHRAVPPWKKGYKAPGIDMSAGQCDLLVRFVASLPRPVQRPPETPQHAAEVAAGEKLFGSVGCTACHRPKLGDAEGIYSDLLLHDMGQSLSDAGSYGTTAPDPVAGEKPADLPVMEPDAMNSLSIPVTNSSFRSFSPITVSRTNSNVAATREKPPQFGAGAREWRTPPLWGLRDSAPYLHDGRADTIEDAVAFHGGEGQRASQAFSKLKLREREQIELFLQSLAAPATIQ